MNIEQEQSKLAQAMVEDRSKADMLETRLRVFEKNVELLNEEATRLRKQVERVSKMPEKLAADVDANRVYLKTVRDDLGAMRTKTVEMLDVQNQRIAEGRKAYVQVLESEMKVLATKLEQMRRAIDELNREMPQVEQEISGVMTTISGDSKSSPEANETTPQ